MIDRLSEGTLFERRGNSLGKTHWEEGRATIEKAQLHFER